MKRYLNLLEESNILYIQPQSIILQVHHQIISQHVYNTSNVPWTKEDVYLKLEIDFEVKWKQ